MLFSLRTGLVRQARSLASGLRARSTAAPGGEGEAAAKAAFAAAAARVVQPAERKALAEAMDKLSLEQALGSRTLALKKEGLSVRQRKLLRRCAEQYKQGVLV